MSVEGMSGRRDRPARRSEAGLSPVIFRRIRQHNRTRRGDALRVPGIPTIAWDRPSIVVKVLKAVFRITRTSLPGDDDSAPASSRSRRHPG